MSYAMIMFIALLAHVFVAQQRKVALAREDAKRRHPAGKGRETRSEI